jgi:hypothetical protein
MPTLALPKNKIMQAATKAALATFAALLLSLFVITTTGCKDDEPIKPIIISPSDDLDKTLPPITTTGAGTFGCLVDGEPWVARTNLPWTTLNASVGPGWVNGQNLRVFAQRNKIGDIAKAVDISINNTILKVDDTIYLKFKDVIYDGSARYYFHHSDSSFDNNYYWSDSSYVGTLLILRLDQYIISGTFEFEAFNKHYNKRVKITNGRFDIHYRN